MPNYPARKLWGNMDPGFIAKRQKELQHYFNLCLQNTKVMYLKVFTDFLMENREMVESTYVQKKRKPQQPQMDETTGDQSN